MIDISNFQTSRLSLKNITQISRLSLKKVQKNSKETYRPVSILRTKEKVTKGIYLNRCQITLKMSFQNFNVALDKVSVHSVA